MHFIPYGVLCDMKTDFTATLYLIFNKKGEVYDQESRIFCAIPDSWNAVDLVYCALKRSRMEIFVKNHKDGPLTVRHLTILCGISDTLKIS